MSLEELLEECYELYMIYSDFEALSEKCDEILEKYPDNEGAMGYKGIALCFLKRYDEALEILERGVELYPDNYYLKNNLAMVYYDLGDYERSLEECEAGLKIRNFDWLCENKLKALIKLHRMDDARDFDDTLDHLAVNLGYVLREMGMADEALDYYYSKLRQHPDDIRIIDDIKRLICEENLDVKPEVGDYYLKWIDAIDEVRVSSKDGHLSFKCISNECGDSGLLEYAQWKLGTLGILFSDSDWYPLKGLRMDMGGLDDVEFNAFLARLEEIGFVESDDEVVMIK